MKKNSKIIAIPPGETIKEQCFIYTITLKDLAKYCSKTEIYINKLINGEVALTDEMAKKLESVFGISSKFWLRLEKIYRDKLEIINAEN